LIDPSAPDFKPPRFRATSWVLYDFANTIYMAAVTYLLASHLAKSPAGGSALGITTTVAMILAGVGTPVFASLADHTGRASAYCAFTTLLCILFMAGFGFYTDNTAMLIVCLFASTVFYQAALVFYNSLLPSVARPENRGLVSGLGVGLGYLGNLFVLLIAFPIKVEWGLSAAFLVATLGFLVIALPCMALVRDLRDLRRQRFSWGLARGQGAEVLGAIRALPSQPRLMWFLLANFFAVDVLNTAIYFFAAFIARAFQPLADSGALTLFGMSLTLDDYIKAAGLAITLPALAYGVLVGYIADRFGATRAFTVSVGCLTGGLAGAALTGGWAPGLFLAAMCGFGGVGLAGVWTAGRKILLELVPPDQVGRYFGLYGITTKVSVIGSTVFGVLMDVLGPRPAILSQVFFLAVAFFCLWKMRRAAKSGPA